MMKKRVFTILMTAVLAFTSLSFAAAAEETAEETGGSIPEEAAEDNSDKSLLEQGKEIGGDLYKKMDEAVDGVDKDSIRKSIREALQQMDEMNVLGIRTTYKSNEKAPENTLIRDAQHEVQKRTEGFFTVLWNGFLDTIEKMITTGISVFGSSDGNVAKGGAAK